MLAGLSAHALAALLDVLSAVFSFGGVGAAAVDVRDLLRRQREYRRHIGEALQPATGSAAFPFDVRFYQESDMGDPEVLKGLLLSQGSRISALEERVAHDADARQRAIDQVVGRIDDVQKAAEKRSAAGTRITEELIALATNVDKSPTAAVLGAVSIAVGLGLGLAGALAGL